MPSQTLPSVWVSGAGRRDLWRKSPRKLTRGGKQGGEGLRLHEVSVLELREVEVLCSLHRAVR